MVQEFHVVRCFSCESFQVQQVKKVKKWTCKLCGQTQSLLKEFGRGSGPDCRRHVQKLNAARGALIDEQEHRTWSLWTQENEEHQEEEVGEREQKEDQVRQVKQVSRWSKYLNRPEEAEPEEQDKPEEPEAEKQDSRRTDRLYLHGSTKNARKRHRSEESIDQRDAYRPPAQPQTAGPSGPSGTSRWDCFLGADRHVQEEEPSVCGRSQTAAAATKHHPQFPVCSMFESGEEFNVDDFL